MADYELTLDADSDLLGIAGYTVEKWGEEQAERYEEKLRCCFEGIALGRVLSRELTKSRPDLRVTRCEHHYVFFRVRKRRGPLILAVFHESMDLMNRLRARLD